MDIEIRDNFFWGTPCDDDYIEIRDGPSHDSPRVWWTMYGHTMDKICGHEIPAPMMSTGNNMWIM